MNNKKRPIHFCLPGILAIIVYCMNSYSLAFPADLSFPKGEVIGTITCLQSPDEAYALYLPSNYTEERKWAVLFAFEPGARVQIPLNLFKNAAEKYGYILVCPASIKNGPNEPVLKAMRAVWPDICSRFAVDKERIYATGFSGGSRMASYFHLAINHPVKGIIGCGAGISQNGQIGQIKSSHYCGFAGYADFNYKEMILLENSLTAMGTPHRFFYFPGKHAWPSEELCTRAVEWLEVMAIKTGLQPKENRQAFLDEIYNKETNLAQVRSKTGEIYYAAADYEALARLFDGLKPINDLQTQAQTLKDSKEYKKFATEEQARLDEESRYIQKFYNVLTYLAKTNPDTLDSRDLINSMDLPRLAQRAKGTKNTFDTALAERLLFNLTMKCDGDIDAYTIKEDLKRAALTLDIALASSVDTFFYPYFLYNRGTLYAWQGDQKKAFKLLEEAIDKGFKNLNYMEKDKLLDNLRNTSPYQKLVERLKNTQSQK